MTLKESETIIKIIKKIKTANNNCWNQTTTLSIEHRNVENYEKEQLIREMELNHLRGVEAFNCNKEIRDLLEELMTIDL